MQNLIQKFRQSSIVFEKPGILSQKLKTLTSSKFAHASYLSISTKWCSEVFLFCLDLELFTKIKKDLVSIHSQKPVLSIIQDLNKI